MQMRKRATEGLFLTEEVNSYSETGEELSISAKTADTRKTTFSISQDLRNRVDLVNDALKKVLISI